jgi:cytoskeletal protein RodZ
MKKLVLFLAIIGFVAFGALSVQNLVASSTQVEIVKFDKDPKKASDKKVAESKDAKAEAKSTTSDENASPSTSSDKSASSKSSCEEDKGCCSHSCPDKK